MEINEDSLSKIHRVFFHELGHFVARELNKKYFDGVGCEEIIIEPCNTFNYDFIGKTIPEKPEDLPENDSEPEVPLERLAQTLANLTYGCIFQAYYENKNFGDCYKMHGHGAKDLSKWRSDLGSNGLCYINNDVSDINYGLFDMLKKDKLLDKFMKINPIDYLDEIGYDEFRVNLALLRSHLNSTIEEHFEVYKEFVDDIQKVIDHANEEK